MREAEGYILLAVFAAVVLVGGTYAVVELRRAEKADKALAVRRYAEWESGKEERLARMVAQAARDAEKEAAFLARAAAFRAGNSRMTV
jgi:hypothetical protein